MYITCSVFDVALTQTKYQNSDDDDQCADNGYKPRQ